MVLSGKFTSYEFKDFSLDLINNKLLKRGEPIPLTYKSFRILRLLIENRERVVSKEEIFKDCWDEKHVEETTLIQHIYRIRKALNTDKSGEACIKTMPKAGYQFIARVKTSTIPDNTSNDFFEFNQIITGVKKPGATTNGVREYEEDVEHHSPREPVNSTPKIKRQLFYGLAGFIVLMAGFAAYFFYYQNPSRDISRIKSIAVLPFAQIGMGKDEKLGLGMADSLIAKLSHQDQIFVSPTTTIIKFLDQGNDDAIDIGEKLGVDAVLTGTIQRENEIIRVSFQLVSVAEKTPLWTEKFDTKFSNIFALQDEVARNISEHLFSGLDQNQESLPYTKYTNDVKAYQSYSMGLFHWNKRKVGNLEKAQKYFQDAVDRDPTFVAALALLADTHALIGLNIGRTEDLTSQQKHILKSRQLAEKALELDPNSAEAITVLGLISIWAEQDYEKAQSLLNKAIKLRPNYLTAYVRLAWLFAEEGKLDRTLALMKIASRIDPRSISVNTNLAIDAGFARKPDEALKIMPRLLELTPKSENLKVFFASVYEQKGEYEKAIRQLETVLDKNPNHNDAKVVLARIYGKTKSFEKSRLILSDILGEKNIEELQYNISLIYFYLGEERKALETLKKMDVSPWNLVVVKNDYNFDSLRENSEFKEIVARMERKIRQGRRALLVEKKE